MRVEIVGVFVVGVMFGTILTMGVYEEYRIPKLVSELNTFWVEAFKRYPNFASNYTLEGELTINGPAASFTVGKEGKYTCVYEGDYEEDEIPIFKSLNANEAIEWAINKTKVSPP